MERYSIKDLEKLSGINAQTIRVWERRYSIITPSRTDTNRRRYGDKDLRKIINISILNRNGFKISHIAALSEKEIEEKVAFLSKSTEHGDTIIDSLIVLMTQHNEHAINDLLIRSIINNGFEDTVTDIMFPFLKRIGVMWQTGSVDIASEHFITNIFRKRIILAIDSLPTVIREVSKRAILFLPENELHEIGLLFYSYIIRKKGFETLYLGQSTPLQSVSEIDQVWNADIIVTGLMSGFAENNPAPFVKEMSGLFQKKKVLVAGVLADIADCSDFSNVFSIRSLQDLKKHLATI